MGLFDPPADAVSFDRVTLEVSPGKHRELSPAEFEALPLSERIRAILGKKLRFYRGDTELPAKDALRMR